MNEKTIKLDIPVILPDIASAQDQCIHQLETILQNTKGIHKVHVVAESDPAQLCLHYNPNLISLASVQQRALQAGTTFTERYRHETIPYAGMTSADATQALDHVLTSLPGMLHTRVNYASGLIFVAYDSEQLSRPTIEKAIEGMGYREVTPTSDDEAHDHGSAPPFLPHWMQERWELMLIGLAGIFLLIGWVGERFLGMPASTATIFYIFSLITGGYDLATHAVPALFKRQFDTDVLMLAAAIGAAILGEWAEGAFLLFLFGLGHAGEHYALDRARNAVNALGELMPSTAHRKQNDTLQEVPVADLQIGDVVVVRPGDRMPVDGVVVLGQSSLDQSPITGESKPVRKGIDDEVFAGTINQEQALDIKVTKLAGTCPLESEHIWEDKLQQTNKPRPEVSCLCGLTP
jgi:Cd2+/Zn2+-exporting ATPase